MGRSRGGQRHLFDDLEAVRFQGNELARVVSKDAHGVDIQSRKNLSADAVFALLAAEGDRFVGVHALLAVEVEQGISGSAPPHFAKIQKNPTAFGSDDSHGAIYLFAAMTGG